MHIKSYLFMKRHSEQSGLLTIWQADRFILDATMLFSIETFPQKAILLKYKEEN